MKPNCLKKITRFFCVAIGFFFLASALVFAQQINLSAGPSTTVLPDGQSIPMWGYSCGPVVSGSNATCAALNASAAAGGLWSPVVITVPTGQQLQINLTNNLLFGANSIPTSLVIAGQLGGGLGTTATTVASPVHEPQASTWTAANVPGAINNPPPQSARVQSFATEVEPVAANATTPCTVSTSGPVAGCATLTWSSLNPGTYLIESGTHPSIQGPMGLYGILVVTAAPTASAPGTAGTPGTAYPGISYNAEVPLLFSEIDPAQNNAVTAAVNTAKFSETATLGSNAPQPIAAIKVTNGGSGYTSAPTVSFGGFGQASATAVVDNTMGSSTFGQVTSINITNGGSGYSTPPTIGISSPGGTGKVATAEAALKLGTTTTCSVPAAACYPPAVNYTPLYYLINGAAFDKTNGNNSLFAVTPAPPSGATTSGTILVRMVNAGLRMHVPSIVGAQTGSAASGFSLIAEDGNVLPGMQRVQSEVFMAAGKTYDVMINVPAAGGTALPVFDRQLSLSANSTGRDSGMLAYISANGATLPVNPGLQSAVANPDTYNSVVPGITFTISDPAKGVIANDINVYGVKIQTGPAMGTVTLNSDGTFAYAPTGWTAQTTPDTFTYCANGGTSICATVTLGLAPIEDAGGITCKGPSYTATNAKFLSVARPGLLAGCTDAAGYALTLDTDSISGLGSGNTIIAHADGSFASSVTGPGSYMFTYSVKNSQGTPIAKAVTATLTFSPGNGPRITLIDGKTKAALPSAAGGTQDYRWIIEEDRTFYVDPTNLINTSTVGANTVPSFGTSFHTSYMPVIAEGCTGPQSCEIGQTLLGVAASCDYNGICSAANAQNTSTTPSSNAQKTPTFPSDVVLDPNKRYYLSVLPGDAINATSGHSMGGASIIFKNQAAQTSDGTNNVIVEPLPLQPAKLSVFVFEDDYPLNAQYDTGGGVDVLAQDEAGLGQFNITIQDQVAQSGDSVGQLTYDMFNQPLGNALAGTPDPANNNVDACPISTQASSDPTQAGITGVIPVCPKYEADGTTLSPLAGHALVINLPPGRYGVVATPGADRIAKGEEWLQTNTLDGQKAHDAFVRVGEPTYFQEFGPAGYHASIGFANPAIINGRGKSLCASGYYNPTGSATGGPSCSHTVTGKITGVHMSRTPDERLYSTGTRDIFSYTQCYVSLGEPDGPDFAFAKCQADGTFTLPNIPSGNFRISVFDQWNDQIIDGYATPLTVTNGDLDMHDIAVHQWKSNLYTRTFFDKNSDGKAEPGEDGLPLIKTHVRYRDGSFSNLNNTDLDGYANFNEVFPLFNWYVVETDTTRFKSTGTHVVYDTGGPVDSPSCDGSTCSTKNINITQNLASSVEPIPLPTDLRFPGSVYCGDADCSTDSIQNGMYYNPAANYTGPTGAASTGRLDPPWVETYGWQSFSGQGMWLEFGKAPYSAGENGGISGHVVYASTRPFDDPSMLIQNFWEPLVPHVTINLYKETIAPDGSTGLQLVDTTQTSSWDDWAQGFRKNADGSLYMDPVSGTPVPNMNCPGQVTTDPFWFTIKNQQTTFNPGQPLPYNSQYKCYDGMHNWNQLQPAPYDGVYKFPSILNRDAQTGRPSGAGLLNGVATTLAGTNCSICTTNPIDGISPMLPTGKYQVEVVVPPGYELVKEEDKNILTGDSYIAPVVQEFGSLTAVFILPDQAAISASFNPNNAQNSTNDLGALPRTEGDTPDVEEKWPCVGESRIVPDYLSIFPTAQLVAPFAGATRNLCDRKEVLLDDQRAVHAKFYIFTSAHVAAHLTGIISDDFSAEFDPFSPAWGEKFSPPNMPVSIKDWAGNEVQRMYSDQWGTYNALTYSTWGVNPPDPSGYVPQMMVTCMNDRGTGAAPDPLYQPGYSQFCYELSFMPGETMYGDTPVIPTQSFADGFNHPDCAYPDTTPAIASVVGSDGVAGPWVSASGTAHTLTISALGDQQVTNNAYSGPQATANPFNLKTIKRHYGFGNATGTVTIGGVPATVVAPGWSDASVTVSVPANVPACALQQQGSATQQCGEVVITAANGKQSIDSVMVTIGGATPAVVTAGSTIQSAIDAANPGDLVIVPPGTYHEMLLMWKPVRLQGVGASSVTIDASTHPSGLLLEPWRRQVVCLFGLGLNGRPVDNTINKTTNKPNNPFDPTGNYTCSNAQSFQVDRLPLEAAVGWDASLNGNLAEQLQEPTIMGAYEGAVVTVLGKGVNFPDPSQAFASDIYPPGTTLLSAANCGQSLATNPYPSNFYCNPSRIDGLTLTNSTQGGGGIFVHGWAHNLEVSNNRVYNNQGTLGGGITIGQGEHPPAYIQAGAIELPGSCENSTDTQAQMPYCFNVHVNLHNNNVSLNSSEGDELFSSTPSGAGGIALTSGADYYQLDYNWVCGNMSSGDGGGISQLGFVKNGDIEHNSILFNQSKNPSIPTNGGGLLVMGAPDTDAICSVISPDTDCPTGLGDGAGPGMVINGNLIEGNSADAGAGGGLRMQFINGSEISRYATTPANWYSVKITNNIITNNVAGWDGAGVSLQDVLLANFVNNTITSNDSTATSGTLFQTFRRDLASAVPPNSIMGTCDSNVAGCTASARQPAGISVAPNSPYLLASYPAGGVTCPTDHPNCAAVSDPVLYNNVLWHNRAFHIELGTVNAAVNQTSVVLTPQLNQAATGGCDSTFPTADYWDLGVRGDLNATDHSGTGVSLRPYYSVLSEDGTNYSANAGVLLSNPLLTSQYCNGSKVPPEFGGYGFAVPPGTDEGNVFTNHYFTLAAGATTDESNNWINMSWGPLAQTNMSMNSTAPGADPDNPTLNNSALQVGSPAVDHVPSGTTYFTAAPTTDFYGNPRPDPANPNAFDVGAIEYQIPGPKLSSISPTTGYRGYNVAVTFTGSGFAAGGTVTLNVPTGISASNVAVANDTTVTATLAIAQTATLGANQIGVIVGTMYSNTVPFTVTNPPPPALTAINQATSGRGITVTVTLTGTYLLTTSAVNVSGTGVTVSSFAVVNDTTVTANLAISSSAANSGPRAVHNVTVTTLGGTSNGLTFTVQPPTLTSITPNTGVQGSTVAVTLTGTNLSGATGLDGLGNGVTVAAGTFQMVSATTVTATLNISGTASVGVRNVGIVTPGGNTNRVTFSVTAPPPPTLVSITPATGLRGTATNVTLTGTNFTPTGTTVAVAGANGTITVGNVAVSNSTTLTATITSSLSAVLGAHGVTVTTPGGSSVSTVTFTVAGPVVTSISPNSGARGSIVPVTITALGGLTGTTAVNISGTRITSDTPVVVNDTTVTANITIGATAGTGAYNVTLSAPGGPSAAVTFTVTNPPPAVLSSISPNSGLRGAAVPVTLTGTNFTAGSTVAAVGVAVSAVTVTNSTTITATFNVSGTANLGAHNVTVTNASLTASNAVAFTVYGPTATSVSPATGVRGTTVVITVTGTNLAGTTAATLTQPAGSNAGNTINCTGVSATSATTVTATCAVPTGAAPGLRNVNLTTPAGTATLAGGFTVMGATLTIGAPTPALNSGRANLFSKIGTITVTNNATGTAAAAFTFSAAPSIAGVSGPGTFSITGGTCSSTTVLAAGQNCTIAVQYIPGTSTANARGNVSVTGVGLAAATKTGTDFSAN